MPWRLIKLVIIFAVILLFVAFNLTNKCDISFGFKVIKDAPVFFIVFASFFLGMLCALPFIFGGKRKKQEKKPDRPSPKNKGSATPADPEYLDRKSYDID